MSHSKNEKGLKVYCSSEFVNSNTNEVKKLRVKTFSTFPFFSHIPIYDRRIELRGRLSLQNKKFHFTEKFTVVYKEVYNSY